MIAQEYTTKTYAYGKNYKVATECHNCGQLFFGMVTSRDDKWESISQMARKEFSVCPVCGKKFMLKKEYSVFICDGYSFTKEQHQKLQKMLREQITEFEKDSYIAELKKQLDKIKTVADMPAKNEIVERVKADIPLLKSYIQQMIDLELWGRFLEEQILNIDEEMTLLNKSKINEMGNVKTIVESDERELLEKIEKLKKKFDSTDWIKVLEKKVEAPPKPKYLKVSAPVKPVAPVMKKPNFFNKKRVLEENERLQNEYEKACEKYEKELLKHEATKNENSILKKQYQQEYKQYCLGAETEKAKAETELSQKIDKINSQLEKVRGRLNIDITDIYAENILKKDKSDCIKILKNIRETQNKLFGINVIYPNYRDIFALSSFYEYFNSERCYELEGPDGAYNLYESERRGDSFSTFFRTLEDINKQQVVLYREASKMFENLKSVINPLKKATKTVVDRLSEGDEITEEFVSETFEKYFAKNDSCKKQIAKTIDDALAYLN